MNKKRIYFRLYYHRFCVFPLTEENKALLSGFPDESEAEAILTFGYYKCGDGLRLEVLAAARFNGEQIDVAETSETSFVSVSIDDISSQDIWVLDDTNGILSDRYSNKLEKLHQYDASNEIEETRMMEILDESRHSWDIDKVVVFLVNHDADVDYNRLESCWVKITGYEDSTFIGILEEEPHQDYGFHKGDEISFSIQDTDDGMLCICDCYPRQREALMTDVFLHELQDYDNGKIARLELAGEEKVPFALFADNAEKIEGRYGKCKVDIQGIGSEIKVSSAEEYAVSDHVMAEESMIPVGLFSPDGAEQQASPHISFTGRVLSVEENPTSSICGPRYGLVVKTYGMTFSLYIDYNEDIEVGNIIEGIAWLFGDLIFKNGVSDNNTEQKTPSERELLPHLWIMENHNCLSDYDLATAMAGAWNQINWLDFDHDENSDAEQIQQIVNEWGAVEWELVERIKIRLQQRDPDIQFDDEGYLSIIEPFMEENGYIDDGGWWCDEEFLD